APASARRGSLRASARLADQPPPRLRRSAEASAKAEAPPARRRLRSNVAFFHRLSVLVAAYRRRAQRAREGAARGEGNPRATEPGGGVPSAAPALGCRCGAEPHVS